MIDSGRKTIGDRAVGKMENEGVILTERQE
jgi:hypothetical protein